MQRFHLLIVLALGFSSACNSATSIQSDSAVKGDSGGADLGSDQRSDQLSVTDDSGQSALCELCSSKRCDADALKCLASSQCVNAYKCLSNCSTPDCWQTCGDQALLILAFKLGNCYEQLCYLPCIAQVTPGASTDCVSPGKLDCDGLIPGFSCCQGQCYREGKDNSRCCFAPGQPCDPNLPYPDKQCCGTNASCNVTDKKCEVKTCADAMEYCNASSFPCCDKRLSCIKDTGPYPSETCCALKGKVLPKAEAALCCYGTVDNNDGTVTCTEPI